MNKKLFAELVESMTQMNVELIDCMELKGWNLVRADVVITS